MCWEALQANIRQTMEVATARVYNWDITMKRKEKLEQEAAEKAGSSNG